MDRLQHKYDSDHPLGLANLLVMDSKAGLINIDLTGYEVDTDEYIQIGRLVATALSIQKDMSRGVIDMKIHIWN